MTSPWNALEAVERIDRRAFRSAGRATFKQVQGHRGCNGSYDRDRNHISIIQHFIPQTFPAWKRRSTSSVNTTFGQAVEIAA